MPSSVFIQKVGGLGSGIDWREQAKVLGLLASNALLTTVYSFFASDTIFIPVEPVWVRCYYSEIPVGNVFAI
jgi:hypothetical protein